eukprot:jgi/Tetstr1/422352/TSEL_013193.t1
MPAAATRRPGEVRGAGGGTLRVVCLGVLGVLGIALTAGMLAGRSGGAGQSGRRSRRSIAQARAPAAASLLPEFRDTANCTGDVLQGRMANYEEVMSERGQRIIQDLGISVIKHRKNWEYIFIISALERLDMLRPGRRGLVFAAGDEPLPSYLAARGVEVVATDMFPDQEGVELWSSTGQHASSLEGLYRPGLVDRKAFDRLVSFQHADMNHISPTMHGQFDFVWSTCSLEHVGSISLGHRFALQSLEVLKPGGAAVHTVEFTLSSLERTVERGDTALWRKQDVERLWRDHGSLGYSMPEPCWHAGTHLLDVQPDVPPYSIDKHIKLMIGEYMCTSMGWVAQKAGGAATS